jgi:hypothetical protein
MVARIDRSLSKENLLLNGGQGLGDLFMQLYAAVELMHFVAPSGLIVRKVSLAQPFLTKSRPPSRTDWCAPGLKVADVW